MKTKIVNQISEIVRDMGAQEGGYLQMDHKNIIKRLEDYDGSFILAIRKTGMDIRFISVGWVVKQMRDNEYEKYYYWHESRSFQHPVVSESNYYFIYYKGEDSMCLSTYKNINIAYNDAVRTAVVVFEDLYPEKEIVKRHIDVRFPRGLSGIMEQIRYAKSIGNETLMNCLRRFHQYYRWCDDYVVNVYVEDAERHNLYFEVYNNGKYSSNGGIILSGGRWSIHT